ncbi:MAG: hypothetical protein Q9209_003678 [Squamulea sp. 1 TL-2023]
MATSPPQHSSSSSLGDQIHAPSSPAPKRTRSVQFFSHDQSMSRSPTSRSIDDRQSPPIPAQNNDGPADEITPIVSNERSGGRRNYATATTSKDSLGVTAEHSPNRSAGSKPVASRKSGQSATEAKDNESEGWWKDLVDKYGTVELDNKGSVARDHLALGMT